jgi:NAD(P)-dependent dehydrogenase (short-subunit alcohol dehydrogenase family)
MPAQTALVTGALRGIGRGMAVELARTGCRVAINYARNAADRFPFSTGAVFDVDGGFHLHRL